jgi:DNA recombination protein RmuC
MPMMNEYEYIIIAALAGLAIGLFLGWLITRLKYAAVAEQLSKDLEKANESLASLNSKYLESSNDLAAARERYRMLENIRTDMTDAFRSVSTGVLKENNESFLDLAKTTLSKYIDSTKTDLDARNKAVENVVQPLKETLDKYDQHVSTMERDREKALGGLTKHIETLTFSQSELQKETGKLASALKVPHVRGRWGEVTLRRVAELSGMQNRCDFFEQQTAHTEDGSMRPDMIVRLPGNRQIVVDAKVPLFAYLEALEAKDDEKREERLLNHARHVQVHIQKLGQKSYWTGFQPTPEFVVLFIPGENFFSAALAKIPTLIEEGTAKNVILSTPTTLISLLKAVAHGWNQETMTENARAISELGKELFERLNMMARHLNRLGRDLEKSTNTYNQVVGSFERRVFSSARKFKELGISLKKGDEFQEILPAETHVRKIESDDGEDTD